MVLLSVLILTSMSFPAFIRRGALVVFVLFVLLGGLIFLVYCVVFLFVYLRLSSAFNNVIYYLCIFLLLFTESKNNFTLFYI